MLSVDSHDGINLGAANSVNKQSELNKIKSQPNFIEREMTDSIYSPFRENSASMLDVWDLQFCNFERFFFENFSYVRTVSLVKYGGVYTAA